MILPIGNDYRIKTDEHNWIIQRLSGTRRNRQTGHKESNWKDVGYYSSLQSCINELHQRMLRLCTAKTLAEALDADAHHLAIITTALTPKFNVSQIPNNLENRQTS